MRTWQGIIIHHTATRDTEAADIQSHRRYHVETRGWRDLGYHAVCEKVGATVEVVCGRPLNQNGAHLIGKNSTHLGFAFVGDFTKSSPPPEMLHEAAQHLAGLCDALAIPTKAIERHDDYWPTACPGSLDIEALRALVDRYRA